MRLSDLILAGKALLRKADEPDYEAEARTVPQRVYKGVKIVKIPNKIRKRLSRIDRIRGMLGPARQSRPVRR